MSTAIFGYFYTCQSLKREPHSHFAGTQFVIWTDQQPKNRSCLLFLNWSDLHGHLHHYKLTLKQRKHFSNKFPIHIVTWDVYRSFTYAGSYMHPVHNKQETSLNVRDGGDSQNLKGQGILRSSNCTNKKKSSYYWKRRCHLVSIPWIHK